MNGEEKKKRRGGGCSPGVLNGAPSLVKQVEEGRVFEAPEAVMQQKVWVLKEGAEASERRMELSCWSPPPPVVAGAERGSRL